MAFLSTAAFAQAAGVTIRTIERHMASGKLTPDHYTPGGHARFSPTQVEQLQCRAPKEQPRGSEQEIASITPSGILSAPDAQSVNLSVQRMLAKRRLRSHRS
jgi:hypothetical protein